MRRFRPVLAVLSAGAMLFLALAAWAISSPVGSSPDEDYHLASIWCGQGERDGLCAPGSSPEKRMIPDELTDANCYIFHADTSAACMGDDVLDDRIDLVDSDRVNGRGVYPSGFYFWMSFLASTNIAVSTVIIRLVNAAIFSVLMVGTWMSLPSRLRPVLAWSTAATLIPLGISMIPSVNPSSWAIGTIGVLFTATLGFLVTSRPRRRILLGAIAVLTAAMSFAARGDSAIYSAVAILAAGVLAFRVTKRFTLTALLPLLLIVAAGITFLSAGQTGDALGGGMGEEGNDVSGITLIVQNFVHLPGLFAGALGMGWGLGWLDTTMPPLVWSITIFVFCGLLFLALRWQGWRKMLALAGVAGALVLIPMYILYSGGLFVGSQVQPRYLLPLMTLLVAVAFAPTVGGALRNDEVARLNGFQLIVAAVLLTVAQSAALFFNMRRYVAPYWYQLDTQREWWWPAAPSPLTTWALGSLFFAGVMAVLVLATWRVQQAGATLLPWSASAEARDAYGPSLPTGEEPSSSPSPAADPTEAPAPDRTARTI